MRTNMMKRKGFTLIELLVVIAIIAILAAILFPVFIAARDKARQTACLNNQKQLGTAMMQYLDDWAGTYPTLYRSVFGSHPYGMFYPLSRYLKNKGVLRCPSAIMHPYLNYRGQISYLVNGYEDVNNRRQNLWGANWYNNPTYLIPPAKQSEVRAPSRVVAIQDWKYATALGDLINGFYSFYCVPGTHNGGITLAMADGHAMWLRTEGIEFFKQVGDDPFTQEWKITYHEGKISFSKYYQP